jgi:hypothetical protein
MDRAQQQPLTALLLWENRFSDLSCEGLASRSQKFFIHQGGEGMNGNVSDFWRFDFQKPQWQMAQAARPDDPRFW